MSGPPRSNVLSLDVGQCLTRIIHRMSEPLRSDVLSLDEFRQTRIAKSMSRDRFYVGFSLVYLSLDGYGFIIECNPEPAEPRWQLSIDSGIYQSDDLNLLELMLYRFIQNESPIALERDTNGQEQSASR